MSINRCLALQYLLTLACMGRAFQHKWYLSMLSSSYRVGNLDYQNTDSDGARKAVMTRHITIFTIPFTIINRIGNYRQLPSFLRSRPSSPSRSKAKTVHSSALFIVKPPSAMCQAS
ncbi:hypothetical protein TNCV_3294031 [Trichonephila clavipes]|nr:hypothetical protein TNCV_3294031 [Trichonephila clavipes]